MSLFFWFHGCLCCAVFLPSEKPALYHTGPASLFLLSLPVCVSLPFCGFHGVFLLFCTPSLPPEQKGPQKPLSTPTPIPREARDLLAGTPLYQPCLGHLLSWVPQAGGSGRVCMKHLDGRAWETTEPSESPGSQVANLTQPLLPPSPPHRLPLLFGRNHLRAPTPPLRTKTPKVGRLGLLCSPLDVVPTYHSVAGLGS